MIKTGKFNPITGEEFLRAEESDIAFWDTKKMVKKITVINNKTR